MRVYLFAFAMMFFASSVWAETFLAGTQDIPQMAELEVKTQPQVDFDTPTGQILTLEAVSKTKTADEVLAFYQSVLPQMGWQKLDEGSFMRENDTISLTVLHFKKPARIRFDIVLASGF